MTQDEYEVGSLENAEKFAIIRMARDGIQSYLSNGGLFNPEEMNHDKVRELIVLCRDAIDLVAAHEREAFKVYVNQVVADREMAVHDSVLAEREACAKVCDGQFQKYGCVADKCAAAIRARS